MRIVILIFFFLACQSAEERTYDPVAPNPKTYCADVKGTAFFECLKKLEKRFAEIESAEPVEKVLSENREGDFLLYRMQVCYSPNFCRNFTRKVYAPPLLSKLRDAGLIFGAGIIAGFGAAQR